MIELLTIRGDGDAKRKPPTGVLLAHGHFEPSALLSVLASTRTLGLVVLDLFGSLFGLRVPRVRITVRPGLEARV